MSATPSISVAMATYQGEKFLQQQLESIAKQTLLPFELVITDDRSSDRTAEIVEAFAKTAPFPVHFYRNEVRLRYAANFLRAAFLCKGELIAFCDQDDLWLEQKLSRCALPFADREVQLVCHSAQTLHESERLGFRFPDFRRSRKLPQGSADPLENRPGFAMVVRKDLLSILPASIRPERLQSHDHWVWFVAAVTGKIVKISEVLCHYRQHEQNVFGANHNLTGKKLRLATETPRYLDVANAESDCAIYLRACLPSLKAPWHALAAVWAKRFVRRSALHTLRYRMYSSEFALPTRIATYLRILLSGGYLPDLSRTRLGPKAALKDLVLGVTSVRRAFGVSPPAQ